MHFFADPDQDGIWPFKSDPDFDRLKWYNGLSHQFLFLFTKLILILFVKSNQFSFTKQILFKDSWLQKETYLFHHFKSIGSQDFWIDQLSHSQSDPDSV